MPQIKSRFQEMIRKAAKGRGYGLNTIVALVFESDMSMEDSPSECGFLRAALQKQKTSVNAMTAGRPI
jgi:hypothetical protein